MWNVKCSECGKEIEKESPEDVRQNIDDDPICEDCPYAEEPDYPVELRVYDERFLNKNMSNLKLDIKKEMPHLKEDIEESDIIPSNLENKIYEEIGSIEIVIEVDKIKEGFYKVKNVHLDN